MKKFVELSDPESTKVMGVVAQSIELVFNQLLGKPIPHFSLLVFDELHDNDQPGAALKYISNYPDPEMTILMLEQTLAELKKSHPHKYLNKTDLEEDLT